MNASNAWQMFDWVTSTGFSQLPQALGHFLWQGCAVAILYALAARLLRPATANTRYLVGVAAMLLMAACLPLTLLLIPAAETTTVLEPAVQFEATPPTGETFVPENINETALEPIAWQTDAGPWPPQPIALSQTSPPGPVPEPLEEDRAAAIVAWALPCTSVLYLCGVIAMLARVALGLCGGRRLRRDCIAVTHAPTLDVVRDHAQRMHMRVVPLIASCSRVGVPVVVGVLRPMILLPTSLISGLTPQELEAVLVHELAHIRRFDPAVNVLQRLVEAMLFFHPAVWWVSRRVSAERENACDDLVLRTSCGRSEYAQALLRMAELCMARGDRAMIGTSALAATGKNPTQFRRRVLRILGHNDKTPIRLTTPGIAVSMLLILTLLLAPAAWRSIAWAEGEAEITCAETCEETPVDQDHKPVSMSAEEFGRLSDAEQRTLLVRVFERRLEHAKNLYYETEQVYRYHEISGRKFQKPLEHQSHIPYIRWRFQYWRLDDSFRMCRNTYHNQKNAEPYVCSSVGFNAAEEVKRNTTVHKDGKKPAFGQVTYPSNEKSLSRYYYWVSDETDQLKEHRIASWELCIFAGLLQHKDKFEIETPVSGDKVRLTMPYQPGWAKKSGGQQIYILDPRKGFLPICCDARYDDLSKDSPIKWRVKKFEVTESRLVDDVWMPVILTEKTFNSLAPEMIACYQTKVLRIEHGKVTHADIRVPFTEGMKIADTVEGVTYTADAQGRPGADLKLAPNWNHEPPKGWKKGKATGSYSMASNFSHADMEKLNVARKKVEATRNNLKTALKALQAAPAVSLNERIEAGLEILRVYRVGANEEIWAAAIRALIQIGKPAVPKLIEELDRTERGETLRALGFVLRGIGDPRSVPALIRAMPRMLQPGGSDFGLRIDDDPELVEFMVRHDNKPGGHHGSEMFSYGTPLREIMPALEKITGQKSGCKEIRFVHLEGGVKQRRIKQELFLKHAQRWADWWSKNWQRYVKNEGEAQLDLIEKSLQRYSKKISLNSKQPTQAEFPRGANVTEGDGSSNWLVRSFDESPSDGFLDLDSGRLPCASKELIKASAGHTPSKGLLAWAKREGVDLITVKIKSPDGTKSHYAFQPVGMKVWRIANSRYDTIVQELRQDKKLELPEPWQGPLAQIDEKSGAYDEKSTASYLFITKEGICGALQIRFPFKRDLARGMLAYSDGGWRYKFIYEGP